MCGRYTCIVVTVSFDMVYLLAILLHNASGGHFLVQNVYPVLIVNTQAGAQPRFQSWGSNSLV